MKCHNCGKELTDGGFCIYCGFPREEKKRASSGKLYYAAAALVACFSIIAAFLIIRIGNSANSTSLTSMDDGELYAAESAYELNDEELKKGVSDLLLKIGGKTELNSIDVEYAINTDDDLKELCNDLRIEYNRYDYSTTILEKENNTCLVLLVGNSKEGADQHTVSHLFSVDYSEGKFRIAPTDEDLYEQYKTGVVVKAWECIRAQFSTPELLWYAEEAFENDDFQWCYSAEEESDKEEMLNQYFLYYDDEEFTITDGRITVEPILIYSPASSDNNYVLLYIGNGDKIHHNCGIDLNCENDRLTIEYKFGNLDDANKSGKDFFADDILPEACKFAVIGKSKDEWPLPDSWKDGPLEISVELATNEGSD